MNRLLLGHLLYNLLDCRLLAVQHLLLTLLDRLLGNLLHRSCLLDVSHLILLYWLDRLLSDLLDCALLLNVRYLVWTLLLDIGNLFLALLNRLLGCKLLLDNLRKGLLDVSHLFLRLLHRLLLLLGIVCLVHHLLGNLLDLLDSRLLYVGHLILCRLDRWLDRRKMNVSRLVDGLLDHLLDGLLEVDDLLGVLGSRLLLLDRESQWVRCSTMNLIH